MNRLKIKNSLLLAILFAFTIISCQKEDALDTSADVEDVTDFLKMASSADAADSPAVRKKCRDITQIDISTVRTEITAYIAANYAGSTIDKAGVDSLGNFFIKIVKADGSHIGLLFDANGNFVKELLRGHKNRKGTEIAAVDLPANASAYITANYATASIHKAIKMEDSTYKVILVLADGSYLGLGFDVNGNFVSTVTVKDKHGRKKRRK